MIFRGRGIAERNVHQAQRRVIGQAHPAIKRGAEGLAFCQPFAVEPDAIQRTGKIIRDEKRTARDDLC
jgi:hypothetical protein